MIPLVVIAGSVAGAVHVSVRHALRSRSRRRESTRLLEAHPWFADLGMIPDM